MNILSFGDCIVPGKYSLHSRFSNVVNYSFNKNLLSIGSKEIGNGPLNIIIDHILNLNADAVSVENKYLTVAKIDYDFKDMLQYNSEINRDIVFNIKIDDLIALQLPILTEQASDLSLAFIFDEDRKKYFNSSFEKSFVNKISEGMEKLQAGQTVECVETIRGCGFGLTPSGDDFIAGLLNALYLLQEITENKNLVLLRENIFKAAETENIISYNAMKMAANGRFHEKMKNMICALSEKDENKIHTYCHQLLTTGETSGADMLTGFLYTFVVENRFNYFSKY